MGDLCLLPEPREVSLTGGETSVAGMAVRKALDSATVKLQGDEAYRLDVKDKCATITARTDAGLRWGEATLAQLVKHESVPCLVIDDAPAFPHRGVMLDISRDRVPKMKTLFELVDHLASWKMNHLQLYIEHTLAYAGHQEAWLDASPVTPEELSALDKYCESRGVALTANQNCLGHFERWLKHPKYAHLGEIDRIQKVCTPHGEWIIAPNTLAACDAKTMQLLDDLLSQHLPLCSGQYANIGCDEPWDIGCGRSKDACEKEGKPKVFSRHLEMVCDIVRRLGKRPQFWCDPHPNEDSNLAKDLVALVWGYEADTDFHARLDAHVHCGREAWVAPGTSCWSSCTGRTWNRRANLDNAASEKDACGFLCTAWGDGGHRQPWPITLFGFADAAMAAWSGPGKYNDSAAGKHAFGSTELGAWLAELGNLDAELCRGERNAWNATPKHVHNTTALWIEMNSNILDKSGAGDIAAWEEVQGRIAGLRKSLPKKLSALLHDECTLSLDIALWTAEKALLRRKDSSTDARAKLANKMADIVAAHRRQWLERCRYGGLESSTNHLMHHIRHQ